MILKIKAYYITSQQQTKLQTKLQTMSAAKMITDYSNINTTCTKEEENFETGLQFGEPKINKHGGRNVNLKYNGGKLFWKLPKMRTPFGIGTDMRGEGFNIQLSLDDDNEEAKNFEKTLLELDNNISEYAIENAYELGITKKKNDPIAAKSLVSEKYKPFVKVTTYSKNKAPSPDLVGEPNPNYPNYITVKIPTTMKNDKKQVLTEFFDKEGTKIQIDTAEDLMNIIPRQSRCTVLVTASSAWSGVPGFGITLNAQQIRIYTNNTLPRGKCLLDDPEDEEEDLVMHMNQNSINGSKMSNNIEKEEITEDEDEDDDVGDEDTVDLESDVDQEPEPEPVPEPVHVPVPEPAKQPKKRITKKALKN